MKGGGERRIALAAIAGAHGVKGELRLKLFSESIHSLSVHQKLYIGGAPRRLLNIRESGKTAIANFEGITDRAAAEMLRGSLVEVDRSELPALEEGEYYHADLIGLPAVSHDGQSLGTVVAVANYGAGDLLEIEDQAGKRALLPFQPGIAQLDEGRVLVDPAFLA